MKVILILFLTFLGVRCQSTQYKVCAPLDKDSSCKALERGSSSVTCQTASDSVDCVLKILSGEAHFGSFTAEEALLLATQGISVQIIGEQRFRDRVSYNHAYQAVAIVRSNHTNGLLGLQNKNYCHPGFHKGDRLWSDYALKEFENKVAKDVCDTNSKSPVEDDAISLKSFFSKTCRPGNWSTNEVVDRELKTKYPELCGICDVTSQSIEGSTSSCQYVFPDGTVSNHHLSALRCTTEGQGDVSYVAWEYARTYFLDNFSKSSEFSLLCPNGTLASITSTESAPCAWISQPWNLVIARNDVATELAANLESWLPENLGSGVWQSSLKDILMGQEFVLQPEKGGKTPTEYFENRRDIPKSTTRCANRSMAWCTTSRNETEKCEWVRAAALVSGVAPLIKCVEDSSIVHCIKRINEKGADVMSIDSNFGYLARHNNLTGVMYHEPSRSKLSRVVVLVKSNASNITRFENLRGKKACFPEYSGIAWVSFVNAGRENGILPDNCDYSEALASFLDSACAPGGRDPLHSFSAKNSDVLCKLCETETQNPNQTDSCAAERANPFFGNKGALNCLNLQGDVAFLEIQNLKEHASTLGISEHNFQVLCKNGTLAATSGFSNIDDECTLSVTVDAEIVIRRDSSQRTSIQLALEEFDIKFGYDTKSIIQLYDPFRGVKDLMFKDSTIGLVRSESTNPSVKNYIALFEHIDKCVSAAPSYVGSLIFLMLSTVFILLVGQPNV